MEEYEYGGKKNSKLIQSEKASKLVAWLFVGGRRHGAKPPPAGLSSRKVGWFLAVFGFQPVPEVARQHANTAYMNVPRLPPQRYLNLP